MKRIVLFVAAAATFAGCSTELEINAPYEENTVVYGLLNMRDSVHLVKINKAFLGEASAYDMALVQDSSEYRGEAITLAVVNRLDANGNVLETYTLDDTLITNREPGTFYSPNQKLFYFETPLAEVLNTGRMFLHWDNRYELRLVIKGRTITSSTSISNDFTIQAIDQDTANNNSRVNFRTINGTDYAPYEFNWDSDYNGKRYVLSYRFRYDEIRGDDTLHKSIIQKVGTRVSQDSQNTGEDMAVIIQGESFYSAISTVIRSEAGYASASRRIFRGLDFIIDVANEDFHTHLTLTEPVSGIIEDRPAYSNVNGAFGVWGSRYSKTVRGKRLGGNSLEELVNGPHTGDLHFCSGVDPGSPNSCN